MRTTYDSEVDALYIRFIEVIGMSQAELAKRTGRPV
jgi:uncharacterized protein YuzE